MANVRQRAFAWLGVALFTVSALALSGAVIIQQLMSNNNPSNNSQSSQSCTDNRTELTLQPPSVTQQNGPITTLKSTDLTPGTGSAAKDGDCLAVKYWGTLASTGKLFDENFTKPSGFAFTLGHGDVIQGWDQGLVGMRAGGTRLLMIPAALGYGSQSPSASIPANSDLVFVVELLRIQ